MHILRIAFSSRFAAVFYRVLHLTEASRFTFPKIIACLVPERKIHGCQVWGVCWPGMLQVTRQDAASKFGFEEVQARRKDMTWGTILNVPILLLCSQYSNTWPHGILKQVQVHFTINLALEPVHMEGIFHRRFPSKPCISPRQPSCIVPFSQVRLEPMCDHFVDEVLEWEQTSSHQYKSLSQTTPLRIVRRNCR